MRTLFNILFIYLPALWFWFVVIMTVLGYE